MPIIQTVYFQLLAVSATLSALLLALLHYYRNNPLGRVFSILALADLGPKLRYVVDSAPFKQGRYTPVSHLPIRPPDTLRSEPVSAVVVMAAGYSDEVATQIRQAHGDRMAVAILREDALERV